MIDLKKLSKYQILMIISSIIFLVSMLGFIFNSNVRVSESYVKIPDIIIEDPIDIDSEDTEPKMELYYKDFYVLIAMTAFIMILYKVLGDMMDV